jgi:DNA-binding CsgD family transcriptional regulator
MAADVRERARDKVARLSGQGLDLVSLWRACREPLATAIPHTFAPCFYTMDPASLLVTSHFDEGIPRIPPEFLEREYLNDDVNQLAGIAKSTAGVSTLFEATDGNPSSSPRWHANMALGGDQEMIVALRTRSGDAWGAIGLYRSPGRPMFDATDKAFLSSIAPFLAEGARRALLLGEAADPDAAHAPGLLVLDADLRINSLTSGTDQLLADLPDGDVGQGRLPSAVKAVAARALRSASRTDESGEVAMARVLDRNGTWLVLHGAPLMASDVNRVAVIIEQAHPARIATLLMAVYGMTDREKDVTRLVLQGFATAEIADALVISPHTVQQHFKSIFDKTGVRSRRDLVGKVFYSHYEPRLRDNERRTDHNRPLRGGPVT